jgi:hypothetical protein
MRVFTVVMFVLLAIPALADTKAKPTVASITAKRDAFVKVAKDLRAFAARVPDKLTTEEKKHREAFAAKARGIADQADAVAKRLTDGLAKKQPLDAMSELGETESLRLQTVMDREAKLVEAVSNALKKEADTASTIIKNLK